jgi:hypothetical protein
MFYASCFAIDVPAHFTPIYRSEEVFKLKYSLKIMSECVERKGMTARKIPK